MPIIRIYNTPGKEIPTNARVIPHGTEKLVGWWQNLTSGFRCSVCNKRQSLQSGAFSEPHFAVRCEHLIWHDAIRVERVSIWKYLRHKFISRKVI